jgi:hypothetical protein
MQGACKQQRHLTTAFAGVCACWRVRLLNLRIQDLRQLSRQHQLPVV